MYCLLDWGIFYTSGIGLRKIPKAKNPLFGMSRFISKSRKTNERDTSSYASVVQIQNEESPELIWISGLGYFVHFEVQKKRKIFYVS